MKSLNAERIKGALDLRTVMQFYGVEFNRQGFAKCCFHEEKTASLSVKGGFFKCFGCGVGGDVISFAMKRFGITFPQALVRLDGDFRLGLIGQKPDRGEVLALRREQQKRRAALSARQQEYQYYTRCYRLLFRAYKTRAPKHAGDKIDSRYAAACRYLPALDYWFDTHEWPRG